MQALEQTEERVKPEVQGVVLAEQTPALVAVQVRPGRVITAQIRRTTAVVQLAVAARVLWVQRTPDLPEEGVVLVLHLTQGRVL